MTKHSTSDLLAKLDSNKFYVLSGPVYVDGAKPGDALVVDVADIRVSDWGWTAVWPGYGLLEEFTEPFLWIWKLRKRYAEFKNGIRIPI
jgi:acetamidase/formamidase